MAPELTTVAELCSPVEAAMFQEALEEAGIVCYPDNTQVSNTFGQLKALGGMKIQVATAERQRAEQVIQAARLRAEAAEHSASKFAPLHHWTCLQCGEQVSDDLATCFACGASREGVSDPTFRHADEPPMEVDDASQRAGGRRLRTTTAVVLLIVGTLVFLGDAARGHSEWSSIVMWLAMWGLAAALWPRKESPTQES